MWTPPRRYMTEAESGVIAQHIAAEKAEAIKEGNCAAGTKGCTGYAIGYHNECLGETYWECKGCGCGWWY